MTSMLVFVVGLLMCFETPLSTGAPVVEENFVETLMKYHKDEWCGMGMKSRAIPDSAISATVEYHSEYNGQFARLDEQATRPSRFSDGDSYGCWIPSSISVGQWIQIDFGLSKSVTGIITQGRPQPGYHEWVRSYKVKCGLSTERLYTIQQGGYDRIFTGNFDADSKVFSKFDRPMTCRYVRVYPESWNRRISLRMELIAGECFDLY